MPTRDTLSRRGVARAGFSEPFISVPTIDIVLQAAFLVPLMKDYRARNYACVIIDNSNTLVTWNPGHFYAPERLDRLST